MAVPRKVAAAEPVPGTVLVREDQTPVKLAVPPLPSWAPLTLLPGRSKRRWPPESLKETAIPLVAASVVVAVMLEEKVPCPFEAIARLDQVGVPPLLGLTKFR